MISCKDEKESIQISGRFFDPKLEVYVDSVEVKIYTKKMSSGTYNYNFEYESTVYSDAEGRFSTSLESQYISDFQFKYSREGYFGSELKMTTDELNTKKGDIGTVEINPAATLHLHIKNQYPLNSEDELRFHVKTGAAVCSNCCGTDWQIYSGMSVDTEYDCLVEGGGTVELEWIVIRNGLNTPHFLVLNPEAFSVTPVDIIY